MNGQYHNSNSENKKEHIYQIVSTILNCLKIILNNPTQASYVLYNTLKFMKYETGF